MSPNPTSQNNTNSKGSASKDLAVNGHMAKEDSFLAGQVLPSKQSKAIKPSEQQWAGSKITSQTSSLQTRPTRWWQGQNLRAKATIIAIAIGTIPVVLTGITGYYFADRSIYRQISTTKVARATGAEDKVARFMRERYGDIQILASRDFLTDPEYRDKITQAEKEAAFNETIEAYRVYDLISVVDLKGNVILKSKSDPLPNQSEREYFKKVLETGQPYISSPIAPAVSDLPEEPIINIGAPVKDKVTGKIIGVIRARLPMASIDELIQNFGTEGDEYYLIDPATQKIFVASEGEEDKLLKESEPVFPGLPKLVTAGDTGSSVFTDELDKTRKLFAYAKFHPLEGLPDLGWQAVIATPTKIAFDPQDQLFLTLAIGTVVAALGVAAVATLIANRATLPIVTAAGAVSKIGQGELDTRLEVEGEDELAELGSNINNMAQQLEEFVREQTLSAEQARLLAEVTSVRSFGEQAVQDIFDTVVVGARKLFNADRIVMYRFKSDGSGEVVAESVASGWPHALNSNLKHPPLAQHLLEVFSESGMLVTNNISTGGFPADHLKFTERLEVKASLDALVFNQGQPFGFLSVHYCTDAHEWEPSEIDFLKRLAEQMRLALDRVTLLEETRNLAEEQRELKESLQKRALELLKEVDPISKGDLTIRARVTEDEIGTIADSYNATISNLRKIVLQVQDAAGKVADTTTLNEASVQSLAAEALRQAEEIGSALEQAQEMAQSVRLVANSAEQAMEAVQQASQTVEEGDLAMNRTVDGILGIRETVAETAKKVKRLGESSQKISTVVNLISTFAAQTNLLALNASIEAARAGEEGRGFAVVADEVRSLAQQSADATSEIEKLVAGIQAETNEVVAAMESGTEQVVEGTKLVDETRTSLNKITAASGKISNLVEAITQATLLQAHASESVTQTMNNVAKIAAQTSTEASNVSTSFEELRKVAQTLQQEVGQFKLN
ncbi:HAMP domain-containing protein [Coleofasciculus sp. LEGE 07092]|nr:HAMP domain-containing protein [Coleofasciculus sp. LEGE 07081]MBE9149151.1 HAMP domain-containing protein [Coleofasciculus sp. LEGE 07092]